MLSHRLRSDPQYFRSDVGATERRRVELVTWEDQGVEIGTC